MKNSSDLIVNQTLIVQLLHNYAPQHSSCLQVLHVKHFEKEHYCTINMSELK